MCPSLSKENGKKFKELFEKREKHEGTRIFRMLLNLATSNYALNRNHQELMSAVGFYEQHVIEIWNIKKRDEFQVFLRELSRLFQNYLSSYYSLIKHTEQFCRESNCAELSKEYSERVKVLRLDDFVRFVYDLRTFSQHFGLPLLAAQLSFKAEKKEKAKGFEQRILLQKEELLKWKRWSSYSQNYLKSNKDIDLKLVMIEHYSLIKTFYQWFYKKVTELFAKALHEYAEIESQIATLQPK